MASEQTTSNATTASPAIPWQFRLWHLFALTTYVAVVMAVMMWLGARTLPITVGVGLMWLNYSGVFAWLQTGRIQAALLLTAWISFIVSMFLPCTTQLDAPGWVGAWVYLVMIPGGMIELEFQLALIVVLTVDLANLLQALLPLHVWRLSKGKGHWLRRTSCVSMVGVWAIADNSAASGYCVWCASFLLALVALPLKLKTLLAMAALLLLELGIVLLSPW